MLKIDRTDSRTAVTLKFVTPAVTRDIVNALLDSPVILATDAMVTNVTIREVRVTRLMQEHLIEQRDIKRNRYAIEGDTRGYYNGADPRD